MLYLTNGICNFFKILGEKSDSISKSFWSGDICRQCAFNPLNPNSQEFLRFNKRSSPPKLCGFEGTCIFCLDGGTLT